MSIDQLWRFHFVRAPVRGMWVRLDEVWRDAIHGRTYPEAAKRVLGEMMATVALVANNIKHDGGVTLHAVGNGPIKTAFAECRGQDALRGIVRLNEDEPQPVSDDMQFKTLIGDGRMALTMQFKTGESYQGLVAMSYPTLERNIENYFESSEQLDTTVALSVDEAAVTGCFLQRLPSEDRASDLVLAQDEAEWLRLVSLFRTIRPGEISAKSVKSMLRDVFPNDSIHLSNPRNLRFECSCNRERCTNALQTISAAELHAMTDDHGAIQVTCEFCGCQYDIYQAELY